MRKLIPALALLLVSVMLLGTSTYAWFSMNNKVTVSGMEVRTRVSDNLFIAKTTLAATAPVADSNFGRAVTDALPAEQLLEPVSTIDGKTFFYTDSILIRPMALILQQVRLMLWVMLIMCLNSRLSMVLHPQRL